MDSDSNRKIKAAFMIGYFISFLRNELLDNEDCARGRQNFLITMMSPQILLTISELFREIFNEPITDKFSTISRNDLKNTLNEIFELISEKIQRGGESFLEISFLCGGLLSLIEADDKFLLHGRKLEIILSNLLTTLELNLCWRDLKKIITELNSSSVQSRRESRDQLFSLICGNQKNHSKIFEIQNLFETNTYHQDSAFA